MSESLLFPYPWGGDLFILNVRTALRSKRHCHNPLGGMSECCGLLMSGTGGLGIHTDCSNNLRQWGCFLLPLSLVILCTCQSKVCWPPDPGDSDILSESQPRFHHSLSEFTPRFHHSLSEFAPRFHHSLSESL